MKIISFFILFVTIVSNNVFGQDYHVKSASFSYSITDINSPTYRIASKYNQETDIHFINNKIILNDGFNTSFEILKTYEADCHHEDHNYYSCLDNNGVKCIFMFIHDINDNKLFIKQPAYFITYDNVQYIYYLNN